MRRERHVSRVASGLWVSGMPKEEWPLDDWGFGLVVSLSEHLPPQAARRYEWGTRGDAAGAGRIMFLHWPFEDGDVPDLQRLSVAVGAVTDAIRHGLQVLVHCHDGRNRCGLVAALAVRELENCPGLTAATLVRAARPGMLSNRSFASMLHELPAPTPAA